MSVSISGSARVILAASEIATAIQRMGDELLASSHGVEGLTLIGIRTRGVPLAERLAAYLKSRQPDLVIQRGTLDISLYRDDQRAKPSTAGSEINFDLDGKRIVLVDDVCFTGRTTRAALDHLMDFGRPRVIELAVLVDRGHRELPIAPNYVGRKIDTQRHEKVRVKLVEIDGVDAVEIS